MLDRCIGDRPGGTRLDACTEALRSVSDRPSCGGIRHRIPRRTGAALDEVQPVMRVGRGWSWRSHPGEGSVDARLRKATQSPTPSAHRQGPAHAQTVCRDEEMINPPPPPGQPRTRIVKIAITSTAPHVVDDRERRQKTLEKVARVSPKGKDADREGDFVAIGIPHRVFRPCRVKAAKIARGPACRDRAGDGSAACAARRAHR